MKPSYIVIHHTASNQNTTTVKAVNAWHKVRGFPKSKRGYYVGYHFLILADDYVQTRDENEIGAHTYGWNDESLGVCLAGNFDVDQTLTEHQTKNLKELLILLMNTHKIDARRLVLHRDLAQTACPGRNIDKKFLLFLIDWREYYDKIRTWKSWLEERKVAKEQKSYFGRDLIDVEIRAIVYGRYGRDEVKSGDYSLFKGKYQSN